MTNMLCGKCGANLVLVGTRHRCIQPPPYKPETRHSSVEQQQARVAHNHEVAGAAPAAATNAPCANASEHGTPAGASDKVPASTYRYRDPDKWRAYMRDYMRKRRASRALA
jgi:hypothetical protein